MIYKKCIASILFGNFFPRMSGVIYIIEYWKRLFKGERNQLMIWGFIEFRTNKKMKMTFSMKILQGLMLKHVYILLILNFPLNMQVAISHLSVT